MPLPLSNGWSVLTPSADTQLLYVSTSGNDGTATPYTYGTGTDPVVGSDPTQPTGTPLAYQTIAAAKAALRDGFPDWVLLKKGDTWRERIGTPEAQGRGNLERQVWTAYGTGPRPILENDGSGNTVSYSYTATYHDWYAFVGLDFYFYPRDPTHPEFNTALGGSENSQANYRVGVQWNGATRGMLVEDCLIRYFSGALQLQAWPPEPDQIQARRNVLMHCYGNSDVGRHSSAIFTDNARILLEENLVAYGGWSQFHGRDHAKFGATVYNHNLYGSTNTELITANRNIVVEASSEGLKTRGNSILNNNAMIRNPTSFYLGDYLTAPSPVPNTGNYINNVTLKSIDLNASNPRGGGLSIENHQSAQLASNLFANPVAASAFAMYLGDGGGYPVSGVDVVTNVVWNYPISGYLIYDSDGHGLDPVNSETGNEYYNHPCFIGNDRGSWDASSGTYPAGATESDYWTVSVAGTVSNQAYAIGDRIAAQRAGASTTSADDWVRLKTGNNNANQTSFTDSTRTLETYLTSIGVSPNTFDEFIARCAQQSKDNWNDDLTAGSLNSYMRAGFDITAVAPPNPPDPDPDPDPIDIDVGIWIEGTSTRVGISKL